MQMEEKHVDMSAQSFFQMKKKGENKPHLKLHREICFPLSQLPGVQRATLSEEVCQQNMSVGQAQQISNGLVLKN